MRKPKRWQTDYINSTRLVVQGLSLRTILRSCFRSSCLRFPTPYARTCLQIRIELFGSSRHSLTAFRQRSHEARLEASSTPMKCQLLGRGGNSGSKPVMDAAGAERRSRFR